MQFDFFQSPSQTTPSNIVFEGGPSKKEQLQAMYEGKYWTVLNCGILKDCGNDATLTHTANAIKAAIQTYGPQSADIPGIRNTLNPAVAGYIYHAHARTCRGKEYIVEWEIIDREKRIAVLVGFAPHENYSFKNTLLQPSNKEALLKKNADLLEKIGQKLREAKQKVERTNLNYGVTPRSSMRR